MKHIISLLYCLCSNRDSNQSGEELQIQPKKGVDQLHKILALHYLVW